MSSMDKMTQHFNTLEYCINNSIPCFTFPMDATKKTNIKWSGINKNNFKVVKLKKTTTYILAIFQMFIAYLYQFVLPRRRFIGSISQLLVIFPLTILALLFNALLPKRYEYFCNNVVLAVKV